MSENNWHEIFPGISLPHKGGTPSFHQEGRAVQKRPGQARRHLETLVSFNVLSAKEDSCSNKSAGRWFLLESVFFENKVDVAMLQGTMEIGTSKTVGEHYVIYKRGASKWRPGYAAGVAVMVRKHRHAGDVTVHNISERLMFLEIKSSNRHDVYGSGYAPGEWDSEEVRTKFYDLLQTTMEALPKRATKHLGIDNNGTVCRCEPCSGKWAQAPDGQPSANGQALLDICEAMTLRIANTHFHDPHPSTCYTYGNGQEQSRQIDFIAIDCRDTQAVRRARTQPQWPLHLRSDGRPDHIPVLVEVSCQKPKTAPTRRGMRWNWEALKDPATLQRFRQDLERLCHEQEDHQRDVTEHWEWLKQQLQGLQQKHFFRPDDGIRQPYITSATKDLIHEKAKCLRSLREAREAFDADDADEEAHQSFLARQAELKEVNRKVRQAVKLDKTGWIEELGQEAQHAAQHNDFRRLYAIERRLSGRKVRPPKVYVQLDSGRAALTPEAEQQAWLQHGLRVFGGREVSSNERQSGRCSLEGHIANPPTAREIQKSIGAMRVGKATKPDGPGAALLKAGDAPMRCLLMKFAQHIVDNRDDEEACVCVPSELRDPRMVWLWKKKGDIHDRDVYRGIGLRHHLFQVIIGVYASRLKLLQRSAIDYWHYGYRAGSSRTHAIFVVRHTLWRLTKAKQSWELVLYDQTKYFDMIDRSGLFRDLQDAGLGVSDIKVFEATLSKSCYEYGSNSTRYQQVLKGVVQGGRESAMLSLGPMNRTLRALKERRLRRLAGSAVPSVCVRANSQASITHPTDSVAVADSTYDLTDAVYADDVASIVLCPTQHAVTEMQDFCEVAEGEGLLPNIEKFERVRRFNGAGAEKLRDDSAYSNRLPNRQGTVKVQDSVKYLGDHLDNSHSNRREIDHRLRCARAAFNSLAARVWKNRGLKAETLKILYSSVVRCHLVGALECYALTKSETAKLERQQNVFLWRLHCFCHDLPAGPEKYRNRPTSERLREWLGVHTVESQLVVARVSWLVDSKLGGPPQVWGLITGVFDFEDQAPRSPWHLLWEKDLGQVKAVLGPDLPAQQTEQIFQHLIGLSEASRKKLLARCLSFRNWETLDRDVFCPDCSSKFLDQRWLRFHQKRVHTHRDPNPEDALLDIEAYNPTGVTCPCCGFSFSCRVSLLQHVRKRAVCREGLKWMWQQHSNGVTPTFPICALSGKAKSKRERARIPNMWRELLVRRLTKELLAQAQFFRDEQRGARHQPR